ncbi:MAG: DUF6498-containing protein [Verrucomicrobiales bacterium]|nr:DUF6498-containing protein [Verrucomicrobiales bacterium]
MILDRVSAGLSGPPVLSGFVLALANMVPVIGVIVWNWSLYDVVGVYWAENLIIGAMNIPVMFMAKKTENPDETGGSKLYFILLFLLHFTLFCVVHAFFVSFLKEATTFHDFFRAAPVLLVNSLKVTGLALLFLFSGHLFSFFWIYIGQRKYRETVLESRVIQPYRRVVILHILILFGAYAAALLGAPMILILGLIVGKTTFDLGGHFYFNSPVEKETVSGLGLST